MPSFRTLIAAAVALPLALPAQPSLASRVSAAPDGEVRMTYAARANACGDGKDVVAIGKMLNTSSMETYGHWSGVTCVAGPARVSMSVRDHQIVGIHSHVGGVWKAGENVTDLGRVPAREAAAFFIALVPRLGARSRMNPLLAAALADSADLVPDLLRFARDGSLSRETRRRAVHWIGIVGDALAVAPLTAIARGESDTRPNADDPGPGEGLQGAATGALAMLEDGVGLDALRDLARHGPPAARKGAVFWLGQSDDARSRALVRTVIEDERETEEVRGAAIFALGQGEGVTSADVKFLQDIFPRLSSERLKDRVLMAMSHGDSDAGARWLIAVARDERQPIEVRKKAVFWAGQGEARIADITALYTSLREPRLREHVLFVLSQRSEEAATDALIHVATTDDDRAMRKKALFWLTQKNDPRVTKLISDLVLR